MGSNPVKDAYRALRCSLRDKFITKKRWGAWTEQEKNIFAIFASDCTGGMLCHDMHKQFNSPTVNMFFSASDCNGVQREHNKKLNNGLPILHKVPPKRDYGRYFCIMAEKGGTSHGGLTEKLSPFFHAKKQEVNAYGR